MSDNNQNLPDSPLSTRPTSEPLADPLARPLTVETSIPGPSQAEETGGVSFEEIPEAPSGEELSPPEGLPEEPTETIQPVEPTKPPLKKYLVILLVLLLVLAGGLSFYLFALPRIKQITKIGEIKLTYWGLWEPTEVMQEVIAEWEKEHPKIKIDYQNQSPKEYRERLQSALARNEGPDIFRFHVAWTPMFKNELDAVPSSIMSTSQFETTFYPVVAANLRSGTSYLGIPLMMDTLALFYNEEIFQDYNRMPPTTWEELRELATELTIKDEEGRILKSGVALGITSNVDHWSDILGLLMVQNGADLAAPETCSQKGEEKVCLGADALTFYTLFKKSDKVWDETMPSSTIAFASGKLAMYFAPSWRIFNLKQLNPQLRFKVVPVPQVSGRDVNWASFWVEGVSKKSQYSKEAWEFLKFLSQKETLEKLYQSASKKRLFGELYPRVEMASTLEKNPLLAPFITQADSAQTWYLCSRTYDNGLNERMIKYFEDAVNTVNQGKAPQEALETAANGINQLLSQYGIAASTVR